MLDKKWIAAFWRKVDKRGPVCDRLGSACWLWLGGRGDKGNPEQRYGQYRNRRAHRVAYELSIGAIPSELVLDHLCRVRHCVNPAHLEPVSHRENILRGDGNAARNVAKRRCKNDHPFGGPNLLASVTRRGTTRRVCRACRAERVARWKEAHS